VLRPLAQWIQLDLISPVAVRDLAVAPIRSVSTHQSHNQHAGVGSGEDFVFNQRLHVGNQRTIPDPTAPRRKPNCSTTTGVGDVGVVETPSLGSSGEEREQGDEAV